MDVAYDTGFEIALNLKYFQSAESVTKSEVKSQKLSLIGLIILISIGRQIIMKRSKARSRTLQRDSFGSTPTTVHPEDFYDSEAL